MCVAVCSWMLLCINNEQRAVSGMKPKGHSGPEVAYYLIMEGLHSDD